MLKKKKFRRINKIDLDNLKNDILNSDLKTKPEKELPRRRLERVWRRTRYRHDRSRYRVQCNLCNRIVEKAKANFNANIILENSEDTKKLRESINNILHRFPAPSMPENLSLKTICEKFSNFFVDKITIIRSKFPDDNELRKFLMNTLTLAAEAEIKKLIMKSKSISSDIDPFPLAC